MVSLSKFALKARRASRKFLIWLGSLRRFYLHWIVLFLILEVEIVYWRSQLSGSYKDPRAIHKLPPYRQKRVYIASTYWNSEETLSQGLLDSFVDLVRVLGPQNVFVSIYENGSSKGTKESIRKLDQILGQINVRRNITMSDYTRYDAINETPGPGWVKTPDGREQRRRVPYIANARNQNIWSLEQLYQENVVFDYVLFLDEVLFHYKDVLALLETKGGNFGAACAMDFKEPGHIYDEMALRDLGGYPLLTPTWPYFRSIWSRLALKLNIPVPVKSCFNGMVAIPALAFYSPYYLRFRGVADNLAQEHVEASESCLIQLDNPHRWRGIYVNPRVRVGYNKAAYEDIHKSVWLSRFSIAKGLWSNRYMRWSSPQESIERTQTLHTYRRWEKENMEYFDRGEICAVDNMQILTIDGWTNV